MKDSKAVEIYPVIARNLTLRFRENEIYEKEVGYWKRITEDNLVKKVYGVYAPKNQAALPDKCIREAIKRLSNSSEYQISFSENENYINVENGVFDAESGEMLEDTGELEFSYQLTFSYDADAKLEDAVTFGKFLETTFPDDREKKTKLLLEAIGYGMSAYTKAKAGFFYIGSSNSGKSTLLELQKMVMPEEMVTAIPLHRLNNRFNIARLHGKKLNICTETTENSLVALDTFKAMTSNEIVTAEHKGKEPFEFRILCKSYNAGNMLPNIDKLEGMDAIINRMVILFFPVSIPKEKQDLELKEKLWEERNIIFSLALKALVELKKNNFIFTEPNDSMQVKAQMKLKSKIFEDFIDECCIKETGGKVHTSALYNAFIHYCNENFMDVKITRNQFAQRVYALPGVVRKKIRAATGNCWGIEGISLKGDL